MALKTPISILQELVVSKREAHPNYIFESIGDLLNPTYSCTVTALSVTASGVARNKKEAKQMAAARVLEQIYKLENKDGEIGYQYTATTHTTIAESENCATKITPKYYTEGINYVGLLNEYVAKNKSSTAVGYKDSLVTASHFEVNCIFGIKQTVGYGRNKKQAKQVAACEMLKELKCSKYTPPTCQSSTKLEFRDELSSRILSKFKEVSTTGVIKRRNSGNLEPLGIKEEVYTIEEATNRLKELNLKYHVETIQENPYCVIVQVQDEPITTMGVGKTEDLAFEKALNQTLSTLCAGCSFTERE